MPLGDRLRAGLARGAHLLREIGSGGNPRMSRRDLGRTMVAGGGKALEISAATALLLSLADLAACGAPEKLLNSDYQPQAVLTGKIRISKGVGIHSDALISMQGDAPNNLDWSDIQGSTNDVNSIEVENALLVKGKADPHGVGTGQGSWIELRKNGGGFAYIYYGFDNDTLSSSSSSGRDLTGSLINPQQATRDLVTKSTSTQVTLADGKVFQSNQLSLVTPLPKN